MADKQRANGAVKQRTPNSNLKTGQQSRFRVKGEIDIGGAVPLVTRNEAGLGLPE